MREAKQRRLAAKGWKTGDAKNFLRLSEPGGRCISICASSSLKD